MKVINDKKRLLFTLKEKTSGPLVVAPEDLLLLDLDGIIKFLKINKPVNEIKDLLSEKKSGIEKIKVLYREGSNIYTKSGRDLEELLDYLDMNKIITSDLECINILIKKITY